MSRLCQVSLTVCRIHRTDVNLPCEPYSKWACEHHGMLCPYRMYLTSRRNEPVERRLDEDAHVWCEFILYTETKTCLPLERRSEVIAI